MKFRSQIHKMIYEICKSKKISLDTFSDDWSFFLSKNNKSFFISGFQFPLDNASCRLVLDDKSAVSGLLVKNNIPCFNHFFMQPFDFDWKKAESYLTKYKKIVIKQNNGTGGYNVFFVNNIKQLHESVNKLVDKSMFIAVSPYVEYETEYRCILLNNKIELVYSKQRPFVVGDGKSTVWQLLKNKKNYSPELNLDLIPAKNKVIVINQKHNLRTGGISKQITDKKIINELETIIKKIVKIFDIHFCSIDFALVKNKFVVVEINGGVMFEKFSQTSKQNYEKCKEIYAKAIDSYLDK